MSEPSPLGNSVSWGPDPEELESSTGKKKRCTFGSLGSGFMKVLKKKRRSRYGRQSTAFEESPSEFDLVNSTLKEMDLEMPAEDSSKMNLGKKDGEDATANETRSLASSAWSAGSVEERIDSTRGRRSKLCMYLALLTAATVISALTYVLAHRAQQNEMTSKFEMYGGEVVRSTHSSAMSILQSISSLSFSLTSHAALSTESTGFPFVTHPHFSQLGEYACKLSKAVFVAYAPMVGANQLSEWNSYSNQEHHWLQDALQGTTDSVPPIHQGIYYPAVQSNDLGTTFVYENNYTTQASSFFPVWQVSPAQAKVASYLNLNLLRHGKGIPKTIQGMFHQQQPVWSSVAPFGNALDHLEHIRKKSCLPDEEGNFACAVEQPLPDSGETFPHTMLFVPVFNDTAQASSSIAGTVMAVFPWDSLFSNLLSEDVDGVVVVADDHCGKVFTFEIDGSNVHYMGLGDQHEEEFEAMMVQTDFVNGEQEQKEDTCQYEIRVYPSRTFVDAYVTSRPTLYALVVAAIFVATALFFFLYDVLVERRQKRAQKRWAYIKARSASEKALLLVQSANSAARAERDLNDYLAHEVRNPLAAALAATNFVSSAVASPEETEELCRNPQKMQSIREDMSIIDNSLHFVNEVLRSTLDMHKTDASSQLKIEFNPADLLEDVLIPVQSMLYQRSTSFQVHCECPAGLVVLTDKMRLKQIVLNLARNSSKFVASGYIRLKATVKQDGTVQLAVEDSGPGVPESKKTNLFVKFQSSHDEMNEGTGVGLSLCKNLTELMGCDLYLDNDFQSGIQGCPGARVVIDLNVPPLKLDRNDMAKFDELKSTATSQQEVESSEAQSPAAAAKGPEAEEQEPKDPAPLQELPKTLRVLQVEDDKILRKLFARSIKRVAPGWELTECSSGESALEIVDANADQPFDLIFLDQYMSTCGKKLTGTETARLLRAKGVASKMCGLSANDVEQGFKAAGANYFLFKPFPCKAELLQKELLRIIHSEESKVASDPAEWC